MRVSRKCAVKPAVGASAKFKGCEAVRPDLHSMYTLRFACSYAVRKVCCHMFSRHKSQSLALHHDHTFVADICRASCAQVEASALVLQLPEGVVLPAPSSTSIRSSSMFMGTVGPKASQTAGSGPAAGACPLATCRAAQAAFVECFVCPGLSRSV